MAGLAFGVSWNHPVPRSFGSLTDPVPNRGHLQRHIPTITAGYAITLHL